MQLGPFTIDDFIARGAAGEVWRGRHARHGTPVALKIIQTGEHAEAELPAEVRTELEALAGMAHPNIVWVHDFGRVPSGIHTATGETLPEGAVWLAMELADRDLKEPGPFTWPQLKGWTDQLLDALGYAHARGVLHRDVKPQNVLLSGPDQTLKLSDFGIAVVRGETRHVAAGTMYYMAPEQELGDLPQLVPATDLFALGVMIWRMVCGKVPYKSMGATFLFQKMKGNFLPFEPTIPVPTDLEDWLKACMRPAPPDRFACAADARHALELLKTTHTGSRRAPVVEEEEDEATIVELATTSERPAILGQRPPPAPMVTDWKRNTVEAPHLLNAGLELFGMRAFPTVGREKERETLWRALVEVRRSREPKVVVISGASGMGRKHLARWVGERAAETGASNLVRLSFAGGAGVVTWLQGEFRCTDTDDESLTEALNSHEARFGPLPDSATQAILKALRERTVDAEVYEAFAHVIALHTSDRPAVVVVQDAITPECWNAVRAVRDHEVRLPVLFVASVRDDLRDRVPDIGAESIELEPLQEDHRVPFIRQLLGLEPALSVRLARITAGSPGFAISVCDHWARQGVLEPGPRGYRLAEGAGADLPTDESWVAQLDELAALSESYTPLLGTAAILGPDVNTTIWAGTTQTPEITGALLTELVRRRLARRTETGFTFTQAAFREAILGKIAPSLQHLAGVCADVLARHGGNEERLAWSLLQAKRWEEATEALFAGARRATANGRFHDVIDLLDRWPEVSAERTLDPADTRNADAMILRLRALQSLGRLPVLRGLAEEAVFVAPLHGWKDLEAWGRVLLARWQLKGDERFDYLQKALALLLDLPQSVLHAETFLELAQFERDRGNLALSVQHNHTATKVAKALKLPNMPRFQSDEARGLALLGRYDDALELAAEAESGALANGGIWTQAMAVFQIGEILFSMEDYPKAQDEFKRSMLLFRRIGDGHEWYLRAMMALAILMQGDKRTAQGHFDACLVAPIRYGDFVAWLGLLSIDENSKSWNVALDKLYEKFIDKGYSNHVFARMFEVAGDFCVGIGARERAASAYTAARQQRAAMGSPTEELDTILARLPAAPPKGAK